MIGEFVQCAANTESGGNYRRLLECLYYGLKSLGNSEWKETRRYCSEAKELIDAFKCMAKLANDEKLANATFIFKQYIFFIDTYRVFWGMLESGEYKKSWDKLQDCISAISLMGRFIGNNNLLCLQDIASHLFNLERLYPFTIFASSEFILLKESCNICKRDISDPQCEHIPGELYFGQVVQRVVEKMEFVGVALVKNPLDKRCIIEIQGDNPKKFEAVETFLKYAKSPLHTFLITEIPIVFDVNKNTAGRNDACPCGSGKKYKKCCLPKKNNEGIHCHIKFSTLLPIKEEMFTQIL